MHRIPKPTALQVSTSPMGRRGRRGSAYVLAAIAVVVLSTLGVGMLSAAWQTRLNAIRFKNETVSMLAAEAGYEQAIYWMGQQQDMLSALKNQTPGTSCSLAFVDGACDYAIELHSFANARPVYKVVSKGRSGRFSRTVDVLVLQAISGWDMGICAVPSSSSSTQAVYFADSEIIDVPVQINNRHDSPDYRDIYITGSPEFRQAVGMGEGHYSDGGSDKYSSVIELFDGGIYFDQPDSKITDQDAIAAKIARFEDSTKSNFNFKPVATAKSEVQSPSAAVQLEFFVEGGAGKVRITKDCTVRGFQQPYDSRTWDFKLRPGGVATPYERYDIYAYHLVVGQAVENGVRLTQDITDSYVTQKIGACESAPGGQIFVDGNVIIGGDGTEHNGDQVVNGKMTVVATGNIWIADSIVVDGAHDADGRPSADNPNILGLIAQGVIKVVDPGMTDPDVGSVGFIPEEPSGFDYVPIGRADPGSWVSVRQQVKVGSRWVWQWVQEYQEAEEYERHLPDPMVVEAALTVGGGGWGAENVRRGYYGGRKEDGGSQDYLVVRGTIVEAMRGVVGLIGSDGFYKQYYLDARLLEGILPGDIWLRGKYIPAPAGWDDYRSSI